jgi:hypothetical protein
VSCATSEPKTRSSPSPDLRRHLRTTSSAASLVAREGLIEADRTRIEERMNFTRENYRLMQDRMLKIIYSKSKYWRASSRQTFPDAGPPGGRAPPPLLAMAQTNLFSCICRRSFINPASSMASA